MQSVMMHHCFWNHPGLKYQKTSIQYINMASIDGFILEKKQQ